MIGRMMQVRYYVTSKAIRNTAKKIIEGFQENSDEKKNKKIKRCHHHEVGAPPRPPSAYALYLKANKGENFNFKNLLEAWRNFTEEEKKPYVDMKKELDEARKAYFSEKKVQRPWTDRIFYIKEVFHDVKKANPTLSPTQLMSLIQNNFKALPQEEKAKYKNMMSQSMLKYRMLMNQNKEDSK
ncbi:hypothetical protein AKO1_006058, partial [Acrasis kona]